MLTLLFKELITEAENVVPFESLQEILCSYHSNETAVAVQNENLDFSKRLHSDHCCSER